MKRSGPIPRYTRLVSGKPVKKRNAKRRASEFARCYGSKERVEWVKSLPCVGCCATPSDNAHAVSGGKGRKADACTIAPLCRRCHMAYDQHRWPFHDDEERAMVKHAAALLDARWQQLSGLTPLSVIVPGVLRDIMEGAE